MVPSFVTPASREYKPNYPPPYPLLAEPAVCQIKILVNFGTSLWQDPRQANVLSVWRFRQGNILGGGHHPANTPHPCQTHATFPSLLPSAIMFSVNYLPPPIPSFAMRSLWKWGRGRRRRRGKDSKQDKTARYRPSC